ncbi:MAG: MFS transporter [Defluviitaleaceae bacterium]|nr:MFS transporter [Defluviitaleaceae bacterium]
MTTTPQTYPDKIPPREKFFFAFGDFTGHGMFMSIMYFIFLTDILMLPPALAGTIGLVTRSWDAILDPIVGVISDNTRTRWGRRRPAIFAAGIFIIFAFPIMYVPISAWSMWAIVAYVVVSQMLLAIVTTTFGINYASLSSEISNDYAERNKANTMRMVFSGLSNLVFATTPLLVRDYLTGVVGNQTAYVATASIYGAIFSVILILLAVNTRERVPMPKTKITFSIKTFVKPLRVRCFRELVLAYTFAFLALDIVTTIFQHFMRYVAHRPGETAFVLGALVIAQILTVPLVYKLTKRMSKPAVFRLAVPIWILGVILLSMYQTGWSPIAIYVFAFVSGIGMCGCTMIPWLMFPDGVDVGELANGSRDAGTYSSVMVMFRQISSAFGIAVIGWVLQLTGYDGALEVQPASAIMGLRGVVMISCILLLGAAFYFMKRNKMTEDSMHKVKDALALMREGQELSSPLVADLEKLHPGLIGGNNVINSWNTEKTEKAGKGRISK